MDLSRIFLAVTTKGLHKPTTILARNVKVSSLTVFFFTLTKESKPSFNKLKFLYKSCSYFPLPCSLAWRVVASADYKCHVTNVHLQKFRMTFETAISTSPPQPENSYQIQEPFGS